MAVHCNEDDVDAPDFEQNNTVDSTIAVTSKSGEEWSRYFERKLSAGSWTRESAQPSWAGYGWGLMPPGGTGQCL